MSFTPTLGISAHRYIESFVLMCLTFLKRQTYVKTKSKMVFLRKDQLSVAFRCVRCVRYSGPCCDLNLKEVVAV